MRTLFIVLGIILFGAAVLYFGSKSQTVQTVVKQVKDTASEAATAAIVAA